jgi:hypothetical protein
MVSKDAEKIYNNYNLRIKSIEYLIKNIIYPKNFAFSNNNTNDLINKCDKFYSTAKKENYEIIYVIIILQELIKSKDNILDLIEFLINREIKTNDEYEHYSKFIFFIICLIVGKNYDDDAMLNNDYFLILKENFTQDNINIMEYKILKLMNFHIKSKYLDEFFDYYKIINLGF